MAQVENLEDRIHGMVDIIISYAKLDFSAKVDISDSCDEIDALGQGINMLGEELNSSVLSLMEKEGLLREIHHRVKNNLQIISSMISLQSYKVKDEQASNYLREIQSRIRTIAIIHEMLYQSVDFKYTNLKNYLVHLKEMISSMYDTEKSGIEIKLDIAEEINLDIDKMIPLGLILNEAITNAINHAFLNGGRICVMAVLKDNKIHVTVQDDGIGLKEGFDDSQDSNLGMQLIKMLSEQADLNMKRLNGRGLKYEFALEDHNH